MKLIFIRGLWLILCLYILAGESSSGSESETAEKPAIKEKPVKRWLPVPSPSEQLTQMEIMQKGMLGISRDLGVNCTACHDTSNFKRELNLSYKIAKEHIRITQVLIDSGFDGLSGRPKATCYMCHRGELKPKWQRPDSSE